MKKHNFTKLFYFFTTIFVLDFVLIIIGANIKKCDDCAGKEALILLPILGFFWLWSWYVMYVAFFMERGLKGASESNFGLPTNIHNWWIKNIHKSVEYDKHPLLTKFTAVFIMTPLCLGVLWAFFNILSEILN